MERVPLEVWAAKADPGQRALIRPEDYATAHYLQELGVLLTAKIRLGNDWVDEVTRLSPLGARFVAACSKGKFDVR